MGFRGTDVPPPPPKKEGYLGWRVYSQVASVGRVGLLGIHSRLRTARGRSRSWNTGGAFNECLGLFVLESQTTATDLGLVSFQAIIKLKMILDRVSGLCYEHSYGQ